MRIMQGTRGMFTRIPGECYHFNIPGNVREDSVKCVRRFRRMFKKIRGKLSKIPGNAQDDFGECSKRFRGIFEKIVRHVQGDSEERFQF